MNLEDISRKAATLSAARDALVERLRQLDAVIEIAKAEAIPEIRPLARSVAKHHTALAEFITGNASLFAKPRTYVVDGIKFGLQKQRGTMKWEDDISVVAGIRKLIAKGELDESSANLLITTVERPVAKALEGLTAAQLKKIGVTVTEDTDAPLIKSVDGAVEKMVNAIIKDITKDEHAEVQA